METNILGNVKEVNVSKFLFVYMYRERHFNLVYMREWKSFNRRNSIC